MSSEIHPVNSGNSGYEHSDIGVRGVLYFLAGLLVALLLAYFIVDGLYSYLDKRMEKQQAAVNPLVSNAPADTRHVTNSYPEGSFPAPRLETDERGQLNDIRLKEEQTLNSYGYIDKNAGTIRIPIERAMDLIAQRGLPVRAGNGKETLAGQPPVTVGSGSVSVSDFGPAEGQAKPNGKKSGKKK